MFCLELQIPPLPYLMTVNKYNFFKGYSHQERVFPLYDIIIVRRGIFYITEDNIPYELQENQMLVLEPGKFHYGHKSCATDTLVYYLHLRHYAPIRTLLVENIQWNAVTPVSSYNDVEPPDQKIYIPKFADLKTSQYEQLLEDMIALKNHSILENILPLQARLTQFLAMLQKTARSQSFSRSEQLCDRIISYLYNNMDRAFHLEDIAQHLNYSIDYLSKCLKKHTGLTPLQYLNHIRMEKAVVLLEHANLTLHEISAVVGIPDYNYFFRLFRKHLGMTPAKYREEAYLRNLPSKGLRPPKQYANEG